MVEPTPARIDPVPHRWDCQSCGQSNPEGMINCPKCGTYK